MAIEGVTFHNFPAKLNCEGIINTKFRAVPSQYFLECFIYLKDPFKLKHSDSNPGISNNWLP